MMRYVVRVMKDELLEVKAKYGDERRSEIVYSSEEFNPEDFYADDQMIIYNFSYGIYQTYAINRIPCAESWWSRFKEQETVMWTL